MLEGWVFKRSRRLHAWRFRWATLWSVPRDTLDFASRERDYRHSTESFDLQHIRSAKAVDADFYGRENCIVVEYVKFTSRSAVNSRLIGIQLPSSSERDRWVSVLHSVVASATVAAGGLGFRGVAGPLEALLSKGSSCPTTTCPESEAAMSEIQSATPSQDDIDCGC